VFTWIDLNVPYYSTYEMVYPQAEGGRRIYPERLDGTLADVARRRCVDCHQGALPSQGFLRVSEPELNDFLVAPLSKSAGGRESCGRAVFADRDDPDYRALLQALAPARDLLAARPREDDPRAVPEVSDRSCQ